MTTIDEVFAQAFGEHCEHCQKLVHCIDVFHSNQAYNCDHWHTFVQFIRPAEEYVNECIYNALVSLQEELHM